MTVFPQYDARLLGALDEQAAAMRSVFAAAGYTRVEPPILQPAEVFLDRSGEEIRRRTFVLTDPSGEELCLRPELTIPVCRMHLASGARFPARLCYHGPAFRVPAGTSPRPAQFFQTGLECLGVPNHAATDREVLGLTVESVRAAGLADFSVKLGDLSLFAGLVDALEIPPQWRGRLKRHFWRPGYFKELLERLSAPAAPAAQRYLAHLGNAEGAEAKRALEGLMDTLGATDMTLGGRTRDEIVERLLEQAAEAAAIRLDKRAVSLIERVLAVSGGARACLSELRALLKRARVPLSAPLDAMEDRIAALTKLGFPESRVSFAANFGRNMEYYTGFVFELWARDREGPVQIAGGGRYDTLLQSLGCTKPHPAMGCAIRGERVLAARRAKGAPKRRRPRNGTKR